MTQETILQLQKMSTFCQFKKDEYICHEGEPGNEMYIILKGSIGIYLTNFFGNLTEVAKIMEGDFFGEMAIFDNQPRSASCIALEDTLCVAINKENLREFFVNCPDLAERVVANMSKRIRHMNDELYKNAFGLKKHRVPKFTIPSAYAFSHTAQEPYQDPRYCDIVEHICPLCGEPFSVKKFRKHMMEVREIHTDGKVEYVGGNPLWHEVYSCPACHYSNHHLSFFQVNAGNRELIQKTLQNDQIPVIRASNKQSAFDQLVQKYLQAIHLHEILNQGDYVKIGMLWMNLYRLSREVEDDRFAKYCAQRAVKKFRVVLDADQVFDAADKGRIALALVNLLEYLEMDQEDIPEYCTVAMECGDANVKQCIRAFQAILNGEEE